MSDAALPGPSSRIRDERGFTLIELLVVVVIIGVLIAIAIPLYLNYAKGANDKGAQSDVRNAVAVLETCKADSGYPASITFNTANGVCSAQTINISSGTTLTYLPASDSSGYNLFGVNSSGSVKAGTAYYCYNSYKGGSVTKKAGAVPSAYATTAC